MAGNDFERRGSRVSRAYLRAVDHEAKLDSPVRVGTSSKSFWLREAGYRKHFEGASNGEVLTAWLAFTSPPQTPSVPIRTDMAINGQCASRPSGLGLKKRHNSAV